MFSPPRKKRSYRRRRPVQEYRSPSKRLAEWYLPACQVSAWQLRENVTSVVASGMSASETARAVCQLLFPFVKILATMDTPQPREPGQNLSTELMVEAAIDHALERMDYPTPHEGDWRAKLARLLNWPPALDARDPYLAIVAHRCDVRTGERLKNSLGVSKYTKLRTLFVSQQQW